MEYQRQYDSIQADFALRAGQLLVDYDEMRGAGPKYEGTLTVCVLQSLLTQCAELIKYLKERGPTGEFFAQGVTADPGIWGLSTEMVREDTFPTPLTLARLLEHMRNAVSHPSFDGHRSVYVPTGFTTVDAGEGQPITAYVFSDSPWVKGGRRNWKGPLPCAKEKDALGARKQWYRSMDMEGSLTVQGNPESGYDLYSEDQLYWPLFQIELSTEALRHLTIELSNYLGNTTLPDWHGRSVTRLLPAVAA